MAAEDWQRLADYVMSRRRALGYESRERFATAAGLSARVLGDLETSRRPVGRGTLAAVEAALRWKPGSARAVLAGGEPAAEQDETARRRFADPAYQKIWDDFPDFPEAVRLAMISLADAMRRMKDENRSA